MQRILNLIEDTLDAEITPAELAEKSGYSLWHFLHLFQQEVGMPLCRYRTRRRLAHAIWHVSGGMGITDAALRWGFGSHSGFFRAFRREYGMSPTAWLRTHRVKEPVVPLIKEEVFKMLTREKFREALSHWGLDLPLSPVTYPGSGEINETAMYAGDDLILKVYRNETACRLAIALAERLHAADIPAALALPLPDGSNAFHISLAVLAHLDLQNLVTLTNGVQGIGHHFIHGVDRDGDVGLKGGLGAAQQLPQGGVPALGPQVVKGHVHRRLGGGIM